MVLHALLQRIIDILCILIQVRDTKAQAVRHRHQRQIDRLARGVGLSHCLGFRTREHQGITLPVQLWHDLLQNMLLRVHEGRFHL